MEAASKELAVKMVDKVETPEEDIKREVELQRQLLHPNVVRVHEVYFERCFVCILMDIFRGGDLLECLMAHWDDGMTVNAAEVVHLQRQMVAAVAFLHSRNVVHRDVKGDNFVLDRPDIKDRQCGLALGDFGTAWRLEPGGRLRSPVGTQSHWAPELYDEDYGLKVDVWALGVITYGMFQGHFPFVGKREVNEKAVELSGVPDGCADFVQSMLHKDEGSRSSAQELVGHPWIHGGESDEGTEHEPWPVARRRGRRHACRQQVSFNTQHPELRESCPSEMVMQRRQELVTRMQTAALQRRVITPGGRLSPAGPDLHARRFKVQRTMPGGPVFRAFEWWSEAKVASAGIWQNEDADAGVEVVSVSEANGERSPLQTVKQMLDTYGIDTTRFGCGFAKTLNELADEVERGASRLMLDATRHKTLVRVVDLVLVHISAGSGEDRVVLLETAQTYPDGRSRDNMARLPGAKKLPHENTQTVATRILQTMLNMEEAEVNFDFNNVEMFEKREESTSYSGLRTLYHIEVVYGTARDVVEDESGGVQTHRVQDSAGFVREFSWCPQEAFDEEPILPISSDEDEGFSVLVPAPTVLREEALRGYLEKGGVDISRFGKGQANSLDQLASELIQGLCSLRQRPDGSLLRVVDVILLKLCKAGTGEMLVDISDTLPDGKVIQRRCLPGGKQRPTENPFVAARRILTSSMRIDENCVCFSENVMRMEEEQADSPSYPGLRTLYRKRVISGEVHPHGEEEAQSRFPRADRGPPSAAAAARWSGA